MVFRPGYLEAMTTADPLPPVQLRDPALMRALAHPARLAIMSHLSASEAATATECAEFVGLSPSATSYHLRALARAGLVREAPSRGDGRERVWTSTLRHYQVATDQHVDPELRAAEDQLVDAFLLLEDQRARDFMARRETEPPEWYAVATATDSLLEVTAAELAEIRDTVVELLKPYRRGERASIPDGTRTVSASFRAIPLPSRDVKQ
jgi:DNA-binding transcriptional ArsR family regulator